MPTYNQKAAQDTRVIQSSPTVNYGDWAYYSLAIGHSGQVGEIFLNFDLSSIPSYSRISSATLKIYQYYDDDAWKQQIEVAAELCGAAWNESSLTWDNKPDNAASTPQSLATVSDNAAACISFSVKDHIQGIVNGAFTNFGFRLRYTGTALETRKYFRSKEYSNSAYHPALIVEYELPYGKTANDKGSIDKTITGIWTAPVKGSINKAVTGMKAAPVKGAIDKTVF